MRKIIYGLLPILPAICAISLFFSCEKEDNYYRDEYLSRVPASLMLEDFDDLYFTLSWGNASGATSYTVQLVDMQEVPTQATIYTTVNDRAHTFQFTESDVANGRVNTVWYARVRANFPQNNYSDWVYLTYDDSDERAVLILGQGMVKIVPEATLLRATSSSLTYSWSFTDGGEGDVDSGYELCLYSSEDCSDESLVVGWTVPESSGYFSTGAGDLPRFTFSGLEPSTTYYAKIRNTSLSGMATPATAGTTSAAAPAVTATADGSAKAGDILVSEDFSKVYHGGDVAMCAAAYYIPSDSRTENIKATGKDAENCSVTRFTANEFDVFDGGGVTAAYTEGTGLSEWAHVGNAAGRSGYIKLATGSTTSSIWTPVLNALPAGLSTVTVSFSAMNYSERVDGSSADPGKLIVQAIAGADVSDKCVASGGTVLAKSDEIDITETLTEFRTYTVTLSGVTPDSRISIGTVEKRALIDDITVTYVGTESMTKLSTPSSAAFDQEAIYSDRLTFKWEAVQGAVSYTLKWWAEGAENSATEIKDISASTTEYTLTDLTSSTTYYAQVKACAYNNPDYDSDWTAAASCATNEAAVPVTPINVTLYAATSSTLTYEWAVQGDDRSSSYNYNVELYKDAACSNLQVSWIVKSSVFTAGGMTNVRFTFSGLEPGTTYYAKITRISEDLAPAESDVVSSSTTTFGYSVSSSTAAQKGDVLVAEDFSGLIHGGDVARKAAGANGGTSVRGSYTPMTGENPTDKGTVAAWNNEFNFFTGGSVAAAYTQGTGLGNWAGTGNTSTRPGYAKIGGGSGYATLYTPVLSTIPEGATATVKVTFSAQIYAEASNYCEAVQVSGIDNPTVAAKNQITYDASKEIDPHVVDITTADGEFKDFSVTVSGLTSASRIAIGSDRTRPAGDNKTRFLLDNVVVTVEEIVYAQQLSTPSNVAFDTPATAGELTLKWDAVANAASYEIEYWSTAAPTQTETLTAGADATSTTITGLASGTEYSARVRAIASGNAYSDSDWSSAVTATTVTPADLTLGNVTGLTVSDRGFSTLTLSWTAVPDAVGYKISYNGTTETVDGATTFTVTGLNLAETVNFSAVAYRSEGDQYNSPVPATVTGTTLNAKVHARTTSSIILDWELAGTESQYTLEIEEAGNSANKKTFTYDWTGAMGYSSGDVPLRFVFTFCGDTWPDGYLSPDKNYLLRVKAGAADSDNAFSKDITATVVARTAPAGEVFYEDFDRLLGGDAVNLAIGVKGTAKVNTADQLSTMFNTYSYVSWNAGGGAMNAGSGSYANDVRLMLFRSEGWSTGELTTTGNGTHNSFAGSFRIGGDNSRQGYLATPQMSTLTEATNVTLSFKTAANVFWQTNTPGAPAVTFRDYWRRDAFEVCDVYVEHADGTRDQVADNLAVGVDGSELQWKQQTVNIDGLLPTDKIVFAATNTSKSRYYIDEISIVKR